MKTIGLIISKIWKKKQAVNSQGFYSTDVWAEIATKYDIKNKLWYYVKHYTTLEDIGSGFIIYGEIYGLGIQGDKYSYNLKEKEFAGFDVSMNERYMDYLMEENTFVELGLPLVPRLYEGKYRDKFKDKYVGGYIEGTNIPHEGCVIKCISGDRKKVSKVINPEYHTFSEKWVVPDNH